MKKLLIMRNFSFCHNVFQNVSAAKRSKCVWRWERVRNVGLIPVSGPVYSLSMDTMVIITQQLWPPFVYIRIAIGGNQPLSIVLVSVLHSLKSTYKVNIIIQGQFSLNTFSHTDTFWCLCSRQTYGNIVAKEPFHNVFKCHQLQRRQKLSSLWKRITFSNTQMLSLEDECWHTRKHWVIDNFCSFPYQLIVFLSPKIWWSIMGLVLQGHHIYDMQ